MNAPRASSPSPLAFQQMARYGATGYSSSFTPQPAFAPEMQSAKGKEPMVDAFDEAAFERAFDMAREDMIAFGRRPNSGNHRVADMKRVSKRACGSCHIATYPSLSRVLIVCAAINPLPPGSRLVRIPDASSGSTLQAHQ